MKRKAIHILFILFLILSFISCDKDVSVSPDEEIPLESGSVYINSNPTGAEIWINSKPSGFSTPDTVKWLPEGEHQVVLKTTLFEDHEFSVSTLNEKIVDYYYDYYSDPRNFGSINITSNPPGSSVYFNDVKLPNITTPHIISALIPGEYKIKIAYPEHRSDSSVIQVLGSQESYINFALVDTSIWVNYNRNNSEIRGNTIYDVFIDEENLVWMATREGIGQFTGSSWNYYDYDNSPIPNKIVNKITKDIYGDYWIGTIKGLSKIESGVWKTFTPSNSSLPGEYVADFAFDDFGNIWIGTNNGLVKIEGDNWKIYNTLNSGLPGNFVKAVSVNRNDNSVWIGTNGFGIANFDGVSKWEYFIKEPPSDSANSVIERGIENNPYSVTGQPYIMGNSISALLVDYDGTVWAGFPPSTIKGVPGGIQRYNGFEWETIDFGLTSPSVNSFFLDDDNTVLVSTSSGIISFGNTAVNIIRELNSPLPTDDIRAVYPDKNGTLWIASGNKGLIKYKNYSSAN